MSRSVIPECGDQRWRSHKGPALILFGSLTFDALLVLAVVGWLS